MEKRLLLKIFLFSFSLFFFINGGLANGQSCITSSDVTTKDETCPGLKDGTATIVVEGGIPNYVFELQQRVHIASYITVKFSPEVAEPSYTFTGVAPGNYRIIAYDSQIDNCIPYVSLGFIIKTKGTTPAAITISGPASVCEDEAGVAYEVPLTAESTYSWSVPSDATIVSGATGPENNRIVVNFGSSSGDVAVVETNSGGCNGSQSHLAVNVSLKPAEFTLSANGATTFCANEDGPVFNLSGSQSGVEYVLIRNGSDEVQFVAGTGAPLSFGNIKVAGNYEVIARLSDKTTCDNPMSGSVSLTVNPIPDAPTLVSGTGPVCQGAVAADIGDFTFGGEAGASFRIYADAGLTSQVGSSSTFDPTTDPAFSTAEAKAFNYYAVQELNGCTSEPLAFSVEIIAKPDADFVNNAIAVCEGDAASLTVNLTGQQPFILVYNIEGGENITVENINSDQYIINLGKPTTDLTVDLVSVTDKTCKEPNLAQTATVDFHARPTASIESIDPVCADAEAFALNNGSFTGNAEDFTVAYNGPGVSFDGIHYVFTPSNVTPGETHEISFTVTNTITSCDTTLFTGIRVNGLPAVTLSAFQNICVNAEEPLVLDGGLPAGGVYSSESPGISLVNGVYQFDPLVAGVGTHTIRYTYTDDNKCSGFSEQDIVVDPEVVLANLEVSLTEGSNTICEGEQVTLTATVQFAGANATYQWFVDEVSVKNSTDNFLTYSPENEDRVYVIVTQGDDVRCGAGGNKSSADAPQAFIVHPRPEAEISSNVTQVCEEMEVTLTFRLTKGTATEENPFTVVYSDGTNIFNGSSASNTLEVSLTPDPNAVTAEGNITYTIISIADANCSQNVSQENISSTIEVIEKKVPRIFSLSPANPQICAGESVKFTASVENEGLNPSYEWYVNDKLRATTTVPGYTLENAAHQDRVFVRLIPGALTCSTLEVADSEIRSIDVQSVDASFTGPASFCLADGSKTYVPSHIIGGTFSVSQGGIDVPGMITSSGVFTPTTDGTYEITYTYTSERECSDSKSLTVIVTPIEEMTVELNSPNALTSCEGVNSFTFSVSITNGGENPTIRWFVDNVEQTGAANQTSFTASNLAQRTDPYIVSVEVVQDAATVSCGNAEPIGRSQNINVYPTPTATLENQSLTICADDNVQLTFNLSGKAPFDLTYTDGVENFVLNGISENSVTASHQLTSDRTFSIVSFSDESECNATVSGEVSVTVTEKVALGNLEVTSSDADNTICEGEQVTLTATVQFAGANATYQWFVDEVSVKNSTDNFLTYSPENEDRVYVIVTQGDDVRCGAGGNKSSADAPQAFIVHPRPEAEISSNVTQVCEEKEVTLTFRLTKGTATEENPFTVVYSDGTNIFEGSSAANTLEVSLTPDPNAVTAEGNITYTIISIADANCSQAITGQSVSIEVQEEVVPAITVLNNSGLEICEGGSVTFTAEVQYEGENPSYEWYVNSALRSTTSVPNFILENAADEDRVYVRLIPGALQCSTLEPVNSSTFEIDVQTIDATITGPASFCLAQGSVTYAPSFIADVENGIFSVSREGADVSQLINSSGVFTPTAAGTYEISYSYTSERECSDSKSLTVVVTPIDEMTVELNSPNTLTSCEETNSFAFSVSITKGGESPAIRWFVDGVEQTGAANQTSFTASDLAQRTDPYIVSVEVVQDAATVNCGNAEPIGRSQNINVYPTPTATLENQSLTICAEENVQLSFNFNGTGLFNLTYTDGRENFVLNNISENSLVVTHRPTNDSNFRIISFSDESGCPVLFDGEVNVTVNSLPAAPVNLEASAVDCGDANVSWNAVTGATSYQLRIASDVGFTNILRNVNVAELSYLAEDLGATATYYFEVTAINNCGKSTEASVFSREIPNSAPLVPTNVLVTDEKCDGFTLAWDAMEGAASYELQLSGDETFTSLIAGYDPFSSSENRHVLTGLQSQNYYLRLRALNSCGISEYSPVMAVDLTDNAPEEATARIEFEQNSCESTVYTVFAVTSNTGNSPTYAWFRNEQSVGNNSNRLDLNEYSEGDQLRLVVTPDESSECVLAEPAVANHTIALPWIAAPTVEPEEITVCSGETPVVTASGENISWYLNEISEAGFLNSGASPEFSSTLAVTVNLIATQKIGNCKESKGDTISVIVLGPTAPPVLPSDIIRCSDEALPEITAEGENIRWYADADLAQFINEGNTLALTGLRSSADGATDTVFYATQSLNGCQSGFAQISIRTNPSPIIGFPEEIVRCGPAQVVLDAGYDPEDGYLIEWSVRTENGRQITVETSGDYWVQVTDLTTNCVSYDMVTVYIIEEGEKVTSSVEIRKNSAESCGGGSVQLEAIVTNFGETPAYEWFRNGIKIENEGTAILNLMEYADRDSISVLVDVDLDCAVENPVSDYIKLEMPPIGTPTLSSTKATVCVGEANPVLTAADFVEGSMLKWYLGSVAEENLVEEGTDSYTPTVTMAGSYTYLLAQYTTRCGTSEAASISFTISDDPNCEPLNPVCENPPVVALGEDLFRCEPATVTLDAGYDPADGYLIEWSKLLTGADAEIVGGNTRTLEVNSTADYVAKVTEELTGCHHADTVNVRIENSISNITVEIKALDELSCGTASLRLEAQMLINGQPYDFGNTPAYSWFKGTEQIQEGGELLELTAYADGDVYRVEVSHNQTCASADQSAVISDDYAIEFPLPSAPILATTSTKVCEGDENPILSVTEFVEGSFLRWYQESVAPENLVAENTQFYRPTVTEAKEHTFLVTQETPRCGISEAGSISFTISNSLSCVPEEPPVCYTPVAVNLGPNQFRCEPATVMLDAGYNPEEGYLIEWTKTTAAGTMAISGYTRTITVSETATYGAKVTHVATECVGIDLVEVEISNTVSGITVAIETAGGFNCEGDPVQLTAKMYRNGTLTDFGDSPVYTWSNSRDNIVYPETGEVLMLNDYRDGDAITVSVQHNQTCAAAGQAETVTATYTIDLAAPPAPTLATSKTTVCVGEENPILSLTAYMEGSSLLWYRGTVAAENIVAQDTEYYRPADTEAGTYTYLVTQTNHRCGTSEGGSISFTISNDANCEVVNPPVCENAPEVVLGEDQIRCAPATVTLDAGYNPEEGYLIEWKRSLATGGFEAVGGNTRNLEVTTTADYIAKVTQVSSGCSDADTVTVNITSSINNITAEIKALDALNCGTASLRLEAQLLVDGQVYNLGRTTTYAWFKGNEQLPNTSKQLELASYAKNEVYSVVVTHNQTCVAADQPATVSASYTIQMPALEAPAVQGTSYTICFDEGNPQFRATSGSNWRWYRGSVAAGNQVAQNVDRFTPADTEVGTYSYFVTQSTDRCGESAATEIRFMIQSQEDCRSNGFNCGVFTATLTDFREPSCGRKNGEMHYEIGGGTAPYFVRYTFSEKLLEQTRAESTFMLDITEIPAADTVRIFIRDSRGRECSLKNVLEMAPQLSATFTKAENGDVKCYGENIGKATLKVEGNPPFQYMLSEEEGWVNLLGNTKEFTNLSAGINSILVRQNEGDECFAAAEVEILSLNPPMDITRFETEKANCNDNIGKIIIHEISGGMGSYKLKLSNETSFLNFEPGTPFVFEGLARGLYTVVVSDGVCEYKKEIRVGSPGLIVIEQPSIIPFSCDNSSLKAGIRIKVKGTNEVGGSEVVGPYLVAISKMNSTGEYVVIPGMEALEVDPNFNVLQQTGLDNGTYAVEVRTASREGCPENVKGIVINNPEMPVPITFTHNPININCVGAIGGIQVKELVGAIQTDYTISIYQENELVKERRISRDEYLVNNGPEGVYEVTDLAVGIYRMVISQEQGGCEGLESSDPVSFRVEEKAVKLSAEVVNTTESYPDRGSGSLTFTVRTNSGKEPYTSSIYLVEPLFPGQYYESEGDQVIYDPIETTFALTYKDMPAGNYELYIVDANGCNIMLTATVGHDKNVFIPNIITPNGDGVNENFYIRNIPDTGTRLSITNRWGKVVYATDDYHNNWSGGDEPDGIYFYHLRIMGGERKEMKGWLEIRRGSRP